MRRGDQVQEPKDPGRTDADGTSRGGEENGLPDSSARRLARVDIQVITSGRGREATQRGFSKSLFEKYQAASRLSIKRVIATYTNVSLVSGNSS